MSKLFSYDVFDTVITRKTAVPHGVFALLADKLKYDKAFSDIPSDYRENFFRLRVEAERYARKALVKPGRYEIDLDDIYDALNMCGELTETQIEHIKSEECRLELENVVAMPDICEDICAHLDAGDRVVFISDMYLPEAIVRALLNKAAVRFSDIPLYISSATGYLKNNGFMYQYVKAKENVEFDNWYHYGDNAKGDVEEPNKLGIHATQVHANLLLPLEKEYISKHESEVSAEYMIGIAKNNRILHPSGPIIDTASSFSGILFSSYALWIIEDALRNNVKTLHFVARDGYVPKMIVDRIISAKHLPLQTKYIYGSRRSWRIPSFNTTENILTDIYGNADVSAIKDIAKLAKTFQITKDELLEFLPDKEYFENKTFARVDMNALVQYLQAETELPAFVLAKNKEKRELAREYLLAELDLSQDTVYFVELGGSGYTQYCLQYLLEGAYDGRITTYYYHAYDRVRDVYRRYMKAFMPYAELDKSMIEPLCRAPQGSAVGYERINGTVCPILEPYEKAPYERCGYPEYLNRLCDYVDELVKEIDDISVLKPARGLLKKYWEHMINEPSEELLEFISEVPFDTSGYDGGRVFAPKLTEEEVADMLVNGASRTAAYYNGAGALVYSLLRLDAETRTKLYETGKGYYPNLNVEPTVFLHMPKTIVDEYEKIAVYGAGRVGKEVVKAIPNTKLSAWVDKDYIRFCGSKYRVESPESLLTCDADVVIIAVLEMQVAFEIMKELVALGVDENKLRFVTPAELILDAISNN